MARNNVGRLSIGKHANLGDVPRQGSDDFLGLFQADGSFAGRAEIQPDGIGSGFGGSQRIGWIGDAADLDAKHGSERPIVFRQTGF